MFLCFFKVIKQETKWLRTLHADPVAVLEGLWCERKLLRKNKYLQSFSFITSEIPEMEVGHIDVLFNSELLINALSLEMT